MGFTERRLGRFYLQAFSAESRLKFDTELIFCVICRKKAERELKINTL